MEEETNQLHSSNGCIKFLVTVDCTCRYVGVPHLELLLSADESKVRRVHVRSRYCFGLDLVRTWNRDTRVVQNEDCHHRSRMQQGVVLPCIIMMQ